MNLADRITFISGGRKKYNYKTGQYEGAEVNKTVVPCFVSDLGLDRSKEVFGDYEKDRKIVRLSISYNEPYDSVEYNGLPYKVISHRLNNKVMYIERDSVGGV